MLCAMHMTVHVLAMAPTLLVLFQINRVYARERGFGVSESPVEVRELIWLWYAIWRVFGLEIFLAVTV